MQNTLSPLLPDWLTRCVENTPDHLAMHCGAVRWSFSELARQVNSLASQLATLGVTEQSRVALLAPNGLAYVACVHALTRLGAILVPLNTRLTWDELRWQLTDVHATHMLGDISMAGHIQEMLLPLPDLPFAFLDTLSPTNDTARVLLKSPDGTAYRETDVETRALIDLEATQLIMYTSGTTGHPKGVLITYGMQWWNALGSALNLGYHENDCWLACLPLFHIGGLSILMRSVIYGMGVNLHQKFDEAAIHRSLNEDGITIISLVAIMLQRLLAVLEQDGQQARYPASLRCVLLGGGPAPRPLLERCASLHIPVAQTYGLTESCSQAVTLAPADALRKSGSAGRPLLPVQLQIRQDQQPAPANTAGVIYLKGPTITPGYADRPAITAAVFEDGWFCTGDLGYLDTEGYLYILDRRSDLIISGGENVYPAEIEEVLLAHPDVIEAGVCGQEHARWGQVPVAFVLLRPTSNATSADILEHARQHLARYKVPQALYRVDQLPRNSAGKLLRRQLPLLLPGTAQEG